MCLCLGPTGSGKTLFLKKLQNKHVDETSNTVPTVGTNLVTVTLANNKSIVIREVGGSMAPIWNSYYESVNKLMFVVDASNLCQIASAGVLFYTLLTEPLLQHVKVSILKYSVTCVVKALYRLTHTNDTMMGHSKYDLPTCLFLHSCKSVDSL